LNKPLKLPSYGGQALIEGVLMRGSNYLAAAMRTPNGEIIIKTEALKGIYRSKLTKVPFLRGIVILWDALGLGTRYLTDSANVQAGSDEKIEGPALFFSLLISFALAILIFFVAPAGIAALLEKFLLFSSFVTNLAEGLIRLIFVILYIWGVGKMPDVKRVFSYHGAEHKTINAFEKGIELTPENVASFSLYHPRCGTGFVIILVIFSVILFTLLGPIPNLLLRFSSRIVLLPLLVMVAYEYMRFAANNINNPFLKWLSYINMKTQRLTTVEPTREMLEVAIAAFNTMYSLENNLVESEQD
jgi:uncharacterized protein YqhQ